METFLHQLDQFLSTLSQGNLIALVTELHSRDVLTLEEKTSLEAVSGGKEKTKEELVTFLKSKKDGTTLKALSQSLRAFKALYKEAQSHIQQEKSDRYTMKDAANLLKPASRTHKTETALLAKFEEGGLSHLELAEALREASQSVNIKAIVNFEGKTLLHLSCCLLTTETVQHLVETYNFDSSVKDNDENTPFHDACRCHKTQIVKYLMSLPSTDLNSQNIDGNTPLHIAIMNSHWVIARILLTSDKLKVPVKNSDGRTPLTLIDMQLASNDSRKMKKDLANHSSMKQIKNKEGAAKILIPAPPLAEAKRRVSHQDAIEVVKTKSLANFSGIVSEARHSAPPAPANKSVKIVVEASTTKEFEADEQAAPTNKAEQQSYGLRAACLTGNPPVICVLLMMVLGVLLGCAIIAIAGGILLS